MFPPAVCMYILHMNTSLNIISMYYQYYNKVKKSVNEHLKGIFLLQRWLKIFNNIFKTDEIWWINKSVHCICLTDLVYSAQKYCGSYFSSATHFLGCCWGILTFLIGE